MFCRNSVGQALDIAILDRYLTMLAEEEMIQERLAVEEAP